MSTTLKFFEISDKQIQQMGVQALANRPNQVGQYGKSGLSAEALKKHFDGLASFLAEKINDLYTKFYSGEILQYITFRGFGDLETLSDLASALNPYSDILPDQIRVFDPNSLSRTSLQSFYESFLQKVSEISETLEALETNKANKKEQDEVAASIKNVAAALSIIRSDIELLNDEKIDSVQAQSIIIGEIEAIPDASTSQRGMMTPADKKNLNTLLALLQNENEQTVDAIGEVLKVFESYPQGVDLAVLLATKAPLERALPSVTADDNGKVPIVVDGVWTLGEAPAIEEVALV